MSQVRGIRPCVWAFRLLCSWSNANFSTKITTKISANIISDIPETLVRFVPRGGKKERKKEGFFPSFLLAKLGSLEVLCSSVTLLYYSATGQLAESGSGREALGNGILTDNFSLD